MIYPNLYGMELGQSSFADQQISNPYFRNAGLKPGRSLINYCVSSPLENMANYTVEELQVPEQKYEYLDHTADVQLHAWGDSIEEAFEQCAIAMFGYITELEKVEITEDHEIEAEGHDMLSLLFHFLDEFLFLFCAEPFLVCKKVKILEFDKENFKIRARGYGEPFVIGKHPQGADIKAITYSNMQVHDNEGQHEVFVIVDI